MQLAGQVGHHHDGAAQDTDDEQFLARVVAVNLLGHLAEPTVHVLGGDEDSFRSFPMSVASTVSSFRIGAPRAVAL